MRHQVLQLVRQDPQLRSGWKREAMQLDRAAVGRAAGQEGGIEVAVREADVDILFEHRIARRRVDHDDADRAEADVFGVAYRVIVV